MGKAVTSGNGKAGERWPARASAAASILLAIIVRWLMTPGGRHYYVGLAADWNLPAGYSATVILLCTIGLAGCVATLVATWDYATSHSPHARGIAWLLEVPILLLAAISVAAICLPPLLGWLVWLR
jgi:hypothetical protein